MLRWFFGVFLVAACFGQPALRDKQAWVTHGPILGHVTSDSIRVMARTSKPAAFFVQFDEAESKSLEGSDWPRVVTKVEDDLTAWLTVEGLEPDTAYRYRIVTEDKHTTEWARFRTLPDSKALVDADLNPEGNFNFSFQFGSCANQKPHSSVGTSLPAYSTLLRDVADEVSFAIMNGDWLYEEKRDYPVESWRKDNRISEADTPDSVIKAPGLVGVWENYKLYLDRGQNLSEWHRRVPSYFTFDDHELLNDAWGAGSPGRVDEAALFRDVGTLAWEDYLGGANPNAFSQGMYLGRGKVDTESSVLVDRGANFEALNWEEMSNLHIHWGQENAGVYEVVEVLDENRLRVSPSIKGEGEVSYSIGRRNYGKFTVSNCDFYLLDTRSHREMHDTSNRARSDVSLLGEKQRGWLLESMKESEADFFFVISTVPFMIPHIGSGNALVNNKDESWTTFLHERELLISTWEGLDKPVFVLTGDLHNSFAVKITDHIWEFCSGPMNSLNHRRQDEGDRPATGLYQFDEREMDIRWSTMMMDDIPREERMHPYYCVVQVNNAFNSPKVVGDERWVAFEHPQVIFKYYEGRSGRLAYAEAVSTMRK